MRYHTFFSLGLAALAQAAILPRQVPGGQEIPKEARAPNTFRIGNENYKGMPPTTDEVPPAVYGLRDIDIPMGRLFHGKINLFQPDEISTSEDNAEQSACGIPDRVYGDSKIAIHPYFFKYAGLDRYCMQDVCISMWMEDGSRDMLAKVTDVCSTDPNDPTHCATPEDIKIGGRKMKVLFGLNYTPSGNQFNQKMYWYFVKCWGDGSATPPYRPPTNKNNWFTTPYLPNNRDWAPKTSIQQQVNNQKSYPSKGWETYPQGCYTKKFQERYKPISDWKAGSEPCWSPIAGGKGYGTPNKNCGGNTGGSDTTTDNTGSDGGNSTDTETPSAQGNNTETETSPAQGQQQASGSNDTTDSIGSDPCGNGGCKTNAEYCAAIAKNGHTDPKRCPQGADTKGLPDSLESSATPQGSPKADAAEANGANSTTSKSAPGQTKQDGDEDCQVEWKYV